MTSDGHPKVSNTIAPAVTAVVVTFNSADVIAQALTALQQCPDVAKIIVVDNASSDDTLNLIRRRFSGVELIANTVNVGFGPANNQGLERVSTPFGFVLNPDAIVTPEAVAILLQVAEIHQDAAILGPLLIEPDSRAVSAEKEKSGRAASESRRPRVTAHDVNRTEKQLGGATSHVKTLTTPQPAGVPGTPQPAGAPGIVRTGSVWAPNKTRIPPRADLEVEFLVGAALFIRMSLVRKSGFFDPNIFLFYEDDDICRSARQAGYSLVLTSKAFVSHLVGQSTPPKPEIIAFKQCHFTWSRLYIEQKANGPTAARQLAQKQLRQFARKQLLARLLRDKTKRDLLKARVFAVISFLKGERPSTHPRDFADGNPSTATDAKGICQMELTACDLCRHTEFEKISDTDRHGKPLETVACRKCGLVRHATVPTEEELQQFYSKDYRKAYNGEATPGTRRIMRAWVNGERICGQVGPLLEARSRVLEVGAGIGCTVKVFEKAGFAAEGIDPGGEFLKFSRDKLRANVEIRNLYDLPKNQQFDAVLLVHVIEHLRSPRQALQHISGLIKPGGMFYVECPNLQAPFARRGKLFHTAHIHNYVPSTLQMLAESCGFRLRKRFGDDHDVNLQMLFQHSGDAQLSVDADNYDRTIGELQRSNPLPYHMRARYITDRIRKVGGYTREFLESKSFVEDLVRECNKAPATKRSQQGNKAA